VRSALVKVYTLGRLSGYIITASGSEKIALEVGAILAYRVSWTWLFTLPAYKSPDTTALSFGNRLDGHRDGTTCHATRLDGRSDGRQDCCQKISSVVTAVTMARHDGPSWRVVCHGLKPIGYIFCILHASRLDHCMRSDIKPKWPRITATIATTSSYVWVKLWGNGVSRGCDGMDCWRLRLPASISDHFTANSPPPDLLTFSSCVT